jgi:hypothetical protein
MRVRRVIYVVESPMTQRDFDRFGLDLIQAAGFDVVVWEVDELFLPRADSASIPRAPECEIRRFDSNSALRAACRGLAPDTAVILVCGVYRGQPDTHVSLIRGLAGSRAVLGSVSAGQRPPIAGDADVPEWAGGRLVRARRRWRALGGNRAAVTHVARRSLSEASRARARLTARLSPRAIRPLDWAWVGTDASSFDPRCMSDGTQVRYLHTWDFDRILRGDLPTVPAAEPYAVYLDAMGPLHPDFAVLGIDLEVDAPEWFSGINAALDSVHRASGVPVVVAAHPRAERGSLDAHYPGRDVVHGATAQLIASSEFVLLSDPTTSLGMVAYFEKPAVVLRPPRLFDSHLVELDRYAALLGIEEIPIGQVSDLWHRPQADLADYREFVRRYMKRPGTPMEPFWQAVAADLAAIT